MSVSGPAPCCADQLGARGGLPAATKNSIIPRTPKQEPPDGACILETTNEVVTRHGRLHLILHERLLRTRKLSRKDGAQGFPQFCCFKDIERQDHNKTFTQPSCHPRMNLIALCQSEFHPTPGSGSLGSGSLPLPVDRLCSALIRCLLTTTSVLRTTSLLLCSLILPAVRPK